jgi:hypothetical protein
MHPQVISRPPALNEHVNHAGRCAVCHSVWPCERVRLADTNLAAP